MDPMEATSDGNLPESMEHSNEQVSSCGAKMSSNAVAGQPVKKIRKRKKQIFNLIRQQMEFYFSDANLSKDRFLKKLIVENPEVPLEVFMTFNKIKSQVTSVEEIEKAVSTSEKLGLSVDRKRVSRITEFSGGAEPDQSADERTIYVEALPTSASHEWVRKVFEQYGPVAYVSLPRFRTSRQIKEFAFVEFENHASVLKAINSFAEFGGALNMSSDPDKLVSVTAYLREKQAEGTADKNSTSLEPSVEQREETNGIEQEELLFGEPSSKRSKIDTTASATNTEPESSSQVPVVTEEDDEEVADAEEDAAKKKVRRKKSTSKHHPKSSGEHQLDASVNTLRITTKIEWKRLRNKYLNQQREKIKQLKAQRRPRPHLVAGDDVAMPTKSAVAKRNEPEAKINRNPKKINFYGAHKEVGNVMVDELLVKHGNKVNSSSSDLAEPRKTIDAVIHKAPLFNFEEGIIAKITFTEPCVDVKEFKAEMRQHPFVRYIDVKEGDQTAFVRIESSAFAPQLVQRIAPLECSIIGGAEEKEYWHKIHDDRYSKLTKQLHVKPVRGRTKVATVVGAAKHVRFGEE